MRKLNTLISTVTSYAVSVAEVADPDDVPFIADSIIDQLILRDFTPCRYPSCRSTSTVQQLRIEYPMGFHTQCFVSRQPIATGNPVVIVPIVQEKTFDLAEMEINGRIFHAYGPANSTVYPTRFWRPVGSFFDALYTDYGRVKLENTTANLSGMLRFMDAAMTHMPVVKPGDNEQHDLGLNIRAILSEQAPSVWTLLTGDKSTPELATNKDTLFEEAHRCWDEVYAVAQEFRTFWSVGLDGPRSLNFAICHRAAFDALVDSVNSAKNPQGESLHIKDTVERALNHFKAQRASQPAPEKLFSQLTALLEALFRLGQMDGRDYLGENVFFAQLRAALRLKVLKNGTDSLTVEQLHQAMKPWMEARHVYTALTWLNLHFEPTVYAPQDYQNNIGHSYAALVAKVAAQVRPEQTNKGSST